MRAPHRAARFAMCFAWRAAALSLRRCRSASASLFLTLTQRFPSMMYRRRHVVLQSLVMGPGLSSTALRNDVDKLQHDSAWTELGKVRRNHHTRRARIANTLKLNPVVYLSGFYRI